MGPLAAVVSIVLGLLSSVTAVLVARIGREVRAVNRAVNHAPPGAPTLKEQITMMARKADERWEWTAANVTRIGHEVGTTVSPPPESKAA